MEQRLIDLDDQYIKSLEWANSGLVQHKYLLTAHPSDDITKRFSNIEVLSQTWLNINMDYLDIMVDILLICNLLFILFVQGNDNTLITVHHTHNNDLIWFSLECKF